MLGAMIRVLGIHITGKARMTFMEIDDMKHETKTTTDSVETEDERYTRLRKERLEWQKSHPNKW